MSRYTYFTDELGHILETHTPFESSGEGLLTPFRKPSRPRDIDTAEKQAMWDSYWDNVASWWEGERQNERRQEWR